jgi:translocation and assembly module TamB
VVKAPPAVRRDTIGGHVVVAGNVKGGLQRFDLRARLAGEDIAVAGNTAHAIRADIAWTNARTPRSTIAIGAQADAATAGGFALDSLDARLSYTPQKTGLVSVAVWQDHIHRYALAGDYAINVDQKQLHLADVQLQFDTSLWHGTQPATVRWGARGVEVQGLDVRDRGNGRIVANGLLPTKGEASLKFAIDNFAVENVASLLESDLELKGLISITGDVQGTLASPRFRVGMAVRNGSYRGTALPDLHGRLQYANRSVTTRMVASRGGGAPMAMLEGQFPINLAFPLPEGEQRIGSGMISADLVADSLPIDLISRFTDAVTDVRGRAAGKIAIRGTLREPKLTGALALDRGDFRIVSTGMRVQNVAGFIRMRDDTVFVDSIAGRSSGPVRLAGTIGLPTFTKPDFKLTFFTQNARVLDNDLGRLRADAELAMEGPITNVYVSGRARVRSGVIYLPESDGKTVISSGDPALFNVVDTAIASNRELLPTQSPLLKGMRMDVTLLVSRGTWVRSRDANVEIFTPDEGLAVHVDRAKQTLALDGVVSTDNGQYTFLTKRFTVTRGSAMFIGTTGSSGEPLNPTLQATGEYQVKQGQGQTLSIRVLIGGTLRQPKLSLESDAQPPMSQSDLLSYLAFGRSSGSLLQLGDGGGTGGSGGTGSGLVSTGAAFAYKRLAGIAIGVLADEFEGDASRSLGADVFNITPADVPTEIYTPKGVSDLLRGTEVEVGKYVDPQTFLSVQARGTGLPGLRAQRRTAKGFRFELSFEPRYKIAQPSLDPPENRPKPFSVFGAFLTREWRF